MKATLKSQFAPENACLMRQGETSNYQTCDRFGWVPNGKLFRGERDDLQIFQGFLKDVTETQGLLGSMGYNKLRNGHLL